MKKYLLLGVLMSVLSSFNANAQDKAADILGMQQKLDQTILEISQVDERISVLESRLEELKADKTRNTDPIENEIAQLNIKKNALLDVKFSTESYLSTFNQSAEKPAITKKKILKTDFDAMPERSQKEILAHPERYEIITE